MLRAEQDWLASIFIKPGGLVYDTRRGHRWDFDEQETFFPYLDLAAGMAEAAEDPEKRYDMKDVSVNDIGGSAKFPPLLPLLLHPYLPLLG